MTDSLKQALLNIDVNKVKDFEPFKELLFEIYKACYTAYGKTKANVLTNGVIDLYKEAKGV